MICERVFEIISSMATVVALAALTYEICIRHRDEKWKQASHVSCWESDEEWDDDHEHSYVRIVNGDDKPIYDVVVSIDDTQNKQPEKGSDRCSYCFIIYPGTYDVPVPIADRGMHHVFNASITFRDSNGVYWHRSAKGKLECKNRKESIEIRDLDLPVSISPAYRINDQL